MKLGILDNVEQQAGVREPDAGLMYPASRRSLTLHRSWLPGAAPEPSGCLSTQESKETGGTVQGREEDLELLKAITASRVFTEFERAFAGATGLPVSLRPVGSFQLLLRGAKNEGPFCALVAQQNRTCGACLQMQEQLSAAARERAHTAVCYAGLCETVVPLRLGNRLVGFLGTGQVFLRKPSERKFKRILRMLTGWGVHMDQDLLRKAYFGTRVMPANQHAAAVKLLEIFAEHLAIQSNQILIQRDNAEPPMITKAKDFIRKHHTEDLSLPQVAQLANASPFYFCKLFKRTTGLSFTRFLSHVRIERCKNLLINPQLRVSEVAYEVGFQSLTHFNRVFQKMLGQSPTEFRQKIQNEHVHR